jgi:hypothetical protein
MSQIKDALLKKHEPKKERKTMGTLMPTKEKNMGTLMPAREKR